LAKACYNIYSLHGTAVFLVNSVCPGSTAGPATIPRAYCGAPSFLATSIGDPRVLGGGVAVAVGAATLTAVLQREVTEASASRCARNLVVADTLGGLKVPTCVILKATDVVTNGAIAVVSITPTAVSAARLAGERAAVPPVVVTFVSVVSTARVTISISHPPWVTNVAFNMIGI